MIARSVGVSLCYAKQQNLDISWLGSNLNGVKLICLDHDLGANRVLSGEIQDPGTGRDANGSDVVKVLRFSPQTPSHAGSISGPAVE
jgi:hypothetical protein